MTDETLQAIADIYKKDDPEDADFYTLDWVARKCASLNKSPADMLADLQAIEARADSIEPLAEDPALANLPPHYAEKFGGPVDGFPYRLEKAAGRDGA